MPPLPAVPNVLRVTLKGKLSNDTDVIGRFFLLYSGTAPTNAQMNTLATSVAADWATNLKALSITTYTLTEVDIVDLSSASGATGSASVSTAGTRAGSVIPGASACVLKFHIARRYRGGHPRLYWPGFTDSDVLDAQNWLTASVSALVTAWNAFMTAVLAHTWAGATLSNQVNVSYYNGFHNVTLPSGRQTSRPTVRGTPVVDNIASVSGNPVIASQRRRNQQP